MIERLIYPDGTLGWLVTDRALGRAVLSDLRFSTSPGSKNTTETSPKCTGLEYGGPGWFLAMDPPDHTRFRRKLAPKFTIRRLAQFQPRILNIVESCLDEFEHNEQPIDLVTAFAIPVSSKTICELIGLPYDMTMQRYSEALYDKQKLDCTEQTELLQEITDIIHQTVDRRHLDPKDDIISYVTSDATFAEDEIISVVHLLLKGGIDTVSTMFAMGAFALISDVSELHDHLSIDDDVVEEMLRYLSIFQYSLTRIALEKIELAEETILEGEHITVSLSAANYDPVVFNEAERFDPSRLPKGHLTFGHGIHKCIGQHLAKVELKIGYAALFERFPALRLARPAGKIATSNGLLYQIRELPVHL